MDIIVKFEKWKSEVRFGIRLIGEMFGGLVIVGLKLGKCMWELCGDFMGDNDLAWNE